MPKQKTETAKKGLLRRVRRQRLKYITILPSLITILNGVCGFTAIVLASKGAEQAIAGIPDGEQKSYFAMSGYIILVAMIADMLDGRLARKVKSTSSFGGQLDSLCDAISFGVAPVFLMLKIVEFKLELMSYTGDSAVQRFIWLAAGAYLCCAVIRLARFNVENEEDESEHMSFMGLPTPAAAGVMVSRIRYPHVPNLYLKGSKPFGHFIRVLLMLAFLACYTEVALVLIFCGFAASSFVKWLYFRVPVSSLLTRLSRWAIRRNDDVLAASSAGHSSAGTTEESAKHD